MKYRIYPDVCPMGVSSPFGNCDGFSRPDVLNTRSIDRLPKNPLRTLVLDVFAKVHTAVDYFKAQGLVGTLRWFIIDQSI